MSRQHYQGFLDICWRTPHRQLRSISCLEQPQKIFTRKNKYNKHNYVIFAFYIKLILCLNLNAIDRDIERLELKNKTTKLLFYRYKY